MRNIWAIAFAVAATGWAASGRTATFYASDSAAGFFATVVADPSPPVFSFVPTLCGGPACNRVKLDTNADTVTGYQRIETPPGTPGGKPGVSYDPIVVNLVQPIAATDYPAEIGHGDTVDVYNLPDYKAGSYLYDFASNYGSYFFISDAPISTSLTFPTDNCNSQSCEVTLDNTTGIMTTKGYTPIYESSPGGGHIVNGGKNYTDVFDPGDFKQPGIYFDGDTSRLIVFALSGGTDPSVPEPASWAMFIGGFGLVGSAMRRRRVNVNFA